jgi:hypothetical protein
MSQARGGVCIAAILDEGNFGVGGTQYMII